MMFKRLSAHLINRIVISILGLLLLSGIALIFAPDYFIFGKDDSGLLMINLFAYMIFLPNVFIDLMKNPSEYLIIIYIILPILICMISLEILFIRLYQCHIGMKVVGLRIVSTRGKNLLLSQIMIRTVSKYIGMTLFPFLVVYIFLNKGKLGVHDKVSRTEVIELSQITRMTP